MAILKVRDDKGNIIDIPAIKGDKGDSGVYIGTEEPTNENVNVWINPNGEAIDLPTGGDPVLLVDFTAENDITGITIDSDDTETKYRAFFFELMTLSSPTNKNGEDSVDCAVRLKINEATCWLTGMSMKNNFTSRAYGYMVITDFSSCGFAWKSVQAPDIINTTNQYHVTTIYGASQKNFISCHLGTQNGTNIMKAGTTLKVWGVKA